MNDFAQLLARARQLDAAAGSPTLVIDKLGNANGRPVTLSYSDVVDLEGFIGGLVTALEQCRGAR
ncbi:hypothetical protein [Sphingomonas sp. S2-65]|uniref:hypothetical protein n=1 Tax=Sphingomonas sp. S2-65 TaxID=2903960 RepID=UPI001F41618D|nr:hypothetical protein [Sphingomonas sp. S2-65]UYY59067.1 hypothetical protein LZ586_02910 [Sphingomonas sp. S2-65]